jgi:hypothetical protein
MPQYVWMMLMAAPWAAGLWVLNRYRRTLAFGEAAVLRSRLPSWMQQTERGLLLVIWITITLVLLKGFMDLHRAAHGDAGVSRPGQAAAIVIALAGFLAPAAPARLVETLIGQLVPALRRARESARQGLETQSLRRVLLGQVSLCLATAPLAIAEGIAGGLEPWTHR